MKNYSLTPLYLTFLFIICACQSKDSFAKLEVTKEIKLGTLKVGDSILKPILLKNNSHVPFRIKDIKTSCGCTLTTTRDSVVEGWSQTQLTARFIARPESIGSIAETIVIEGNTDPPYSVLYLQGDVVAE